MWELLRTLAEGRRFLVQILNWVLLQVSLLLHAVFGDALGDVVELCLLRDNLLILMLSKLLGVLFSPLLNKAGTDSFTVPNFCLSYIC